MDGLVRVFTGEGREKTSAAMGLTLRAAGAGGRGYIGHFLRNWEDEEWRGLSRLDGDAIFRQFGRRALMEEELREDDFREAREALDEIHRAIWSGAYSLVILDDVNIAACLSLFSVEDLLSLIEAKPREVGLVFVGCCADPRIIRRVDMVTTLQEIKGRNQAR
jgi:cob(I)alamin adenosyltransferase